LGAVLTDILTPHAYPDAVAKLVAEAVVLAPLLGGMLKFEGTFTLQAQGDGPVRLVVADLTTAGAVRGMATFKAEKLATIVSEDVVSLHPNHRLHDLKQLLSEGFLTFTVDQGEHSERYQGIVELNQPDLAACVTHYFMQSDQIETYLKIAAGRIENEWRAGGVMIQRLPLPADQQTPEGIAQAEDDWERATALLHTCTDDELIRPSLGASDLLYRLFHEEGVRVYNPVRLSKGCRCSTEKLQGILTTLSADDRAHLTVDGAITMNCEFCNKHFRFDQNQ
jgi:molecular chaperone Hsp33